MAKYEIVDTEHPEWKGQTFGELWRAQREQAASVPPGRFVVMVREGRLRRHLMKGLDY